MVDPEAGRPSSDVAKEYIGQAASAAVASDVSLVHLPCRHGRIAEESEWCDTARDRSNPSHTNDLEGLRRTHAGAPPLPWPARLKTSCNGRPLGDTLG